MKLSVGLMLYRQKAGAVEVLIVHPGGPFWAKKDLGAWSIPKGVIEKDEGTLEVARREFKEEIGQPAPEGAYSDLGEVKLASGKIIKAWLVESDLDLSNFHSNTTEIEWPPRSGKKLEIPEVDKAEWFSLEMAAKKLHPKQVAFIERLAKQLNINLEASPQATAHQASLF